MTRVKLERWRAHLAAARDQGVSIARYAREHGLSRFTLYAAQRQWRSEQRVAARRSGRHGSSVVANASPFVRVEMAAPAALLRVRLPNGVELEFHLLHAARLAGLGRRTTPHASRVLGAVATQGRRQVIARCSPRPFGRSRGKKRVSQRVPSSALGCQRQPNQQLRPPARNSRSASRAIA